MKIATVAGAVTALAAALVLSACGSADPPEGPGAPAVSTTADPTASAHNDADTAFVQGMIPHHSQAVTMAKMATDRAADERVKQLASRIDVAQAPEIAEMRGFLAAWGVSEAPGAMSGMDHGQTGPDMGGGMMSDQQMQQLGQTRGAAFDRLFLQQMTQHHEGAVQMARTELSSGVNPEAKSLAQRVIDTQRAEIDEMKQILGT